ncbi:DUF7573 domain-containing protein [Halobaculum halobium]|uniref:DUF7573 domain-containing protein n=1 Tax=Halobaculum halobium TaxID=3032281 RepID=A0ABD5TGN1_9EURY|nr:hypothetical protein [Halobaculum sp. SYNS20]
MSEDRTLEEFAAADGGGGEGGDAPDGTADGDDPDVDATEAPSGAVDADAVDPAEPTYNVSPDGAPCATCDASVTRRWRQEGDYVCGECKEW